uniref:DNA-directed RNA polymerase III subunit RPC3 n=1 Tax=Plectus sambesii TaxID=2011161 RepID=A0A914UZB7_9BILA
MPDSVVPASTSSDGAAGKKRKLEEMEKEKAPDLAILWRLNWQRFDQYFRDEVVLELIESMGNEKCVEVTRALLKISELKSDTGTASFPISVHDVVRVAASNDMNLPKSVIESCLEFLSEDQTRIIRRAGDSGGGMYVIDFEKALQAMCKFTIESVIRETFDTKGVRVFNLLLAKGYLEQEQMEKFAMLSSKEGKELTYQLMKEGFISVRELAKSNDFAPARTFYVFHVEMRRVAHTLYLRSCK